MFVGRSTIQRVLADHGIEPAPERDKHTRWSTFLRAHWGAIAATDFFSVEVLTLSGLVRHFVLFVIDLKSRRVEDRWHCSPAPRSVDEAGRAQPDRCGRRLPARHMEAHSRS
jgi:hypothetical protein